MGIIEIFPSKQIYLSFIGREKRSRVLYLERIDGVLVMQEITIITQHIFASINKSGSRA